MVKTGPVLYFSPAKTCYCCKINTTLALHPSHRSWFYLFRECKTMVVMFHFLSTKTLERDASPVYQCQLNLRASGEHSRWANGIGPRPRSSVCQHAKIVFCAFGSICFIANTSYWGMWLFLAYCRNAQF